MTVLIALLSCVGLIFLVLFKPTIGKLPTHWISPFIGSLILLTLGYVELDKIVSGEGINPLKLLVLFISLTLLSIFLDEVGFFKWLASQVLKKSGGNQFKLFTAMYALVMILTIFMANDIVILTFTPFICYFTKNAKINPLPYLFGEFVVANTASVLLIIGNPTNIYLASAFNITFLDYLRVMALPTFLAVLTSYLILVAIFRKDLRKTISISECEYQIENKPLLFLGLILLFSCTFTLTLSSYLNWQMWQISFTCACLLVLLSLLLSLLYKKKPSELINTLKRIPYDLIPFVLSMFVIVSTIDTSFIKLPDNVFVYGGLAFLCANLLNNIPMSVFFASFTPSVSSTYAVIFASNVAAYLTPLGALAGLLWWSILKRQKIQLSFLQFVRYGIFVSIPVLLVGLFSLFLFA